jgi:GT2 family glycosyltransferase
VALIDDGRDYFETSWLQGRIMAYSMSAIRQDTFSADLFALDHVRCGLGEDTFLSRRVGARGKLLYTFRAVVDHPNADSPKSYPFEAYQYAYAATYSRRFQNDHYRVDQRPTRADRLALVKSYLGGIFLAWARAIRKPDRANAARARGTTLGALHGLTRPPTAKRLTPGIDWWKAADEALVNAATVQQPRIVAGK